MEFILIGVVVIAAAVIYFRRDKVMQLLSSLKSKLDK